MPLTAGPFHPLRLLPPFAGVICLLSGGLHLVALAMTGDAGTVSLVLGVMAGACFWCGMHLLQHGTRAAWVTALTVNAGMVALHWTMPREPITGAAHMHGGHRGTSPAVDLVMSSATMIAAAEVALACAALVAFILHARAGRPSAYGCLALEANGALQLPRVTLASADEEGRGPAWTSHPSP